GSTGICDSQSGRIFHIKILGRPHTRGGWCHFPLIKVRKKYFGKNLRTDHCRQGGIGVPSRGLLSRAENLYDRDRGAEPERADLGDRAGAVAGVPVHHRGSWWTATRTQARNAPGTPSQWPAHLRLPLTGSLPLKRPSEKPQERRVRGG